MILIPELEAVLLLTPRNASGALYRAVLERHPKSIMLYRHMEAQNVPLGYDRWRKIGVVREPVSRLWSFYNFFKQISRSDKARIYPEWGAKIRRSVDRTFDDWITGNTVVFSAGHDGDYASDFYPFYVVSQQIPENCKSQFITLRPDLGTKVFRFEDELDALCDALAVTLPTANATTSGEPPALGAEAVRHVERHFAWDLAFYSSAGAA